MVDWNLFIAGALGLAPSLILMWHSLRRFDYPLAPRTLFDDRKVFVLFAVGMVMGIVSGTFLNLFSASTLFGLWILLMLLALLEEGFKMVLLSLKRFQGRFDTTFYGLSLGAGMASTWIVPQAYLTFIQIPEAVADPMVFSSLLLLSVGTAALHCATGSLIGYGAAHGRGMSHFLEAILMRVAYASAILSLFIFTGSPFLALAFPVAGLVVAAVFYRYAYTVILPGTLPDEVRRELRRAARRHKE
jgi:hypothetical protein